MGWMYFHEDWLCELLAASLVVLHDLEFSMKGCLFGVVCGGMMIPRLRQDGVYVRLPSLL